MTTDNVNDVHFFDREKLGFIRKWWIDIDRVTFLLVIGLMFFGLAMAFTASQAVADRIGAASLFFVQKQLVFVAIGLLLMISVSFFTQNQVKLLGIFGLFAVIILLMAVLLFGSEAKGAKRWINLGGFSMQPSEFAKTFFLIFNAFLLQKLNDRVWLVKYGWSAFFYALIACLLIAQPDFGMTLTLTALWLAQLFVFGLNLILVVAAALLGCVGAVLAYFTFPHVADRVNKFLGAEGENYQVERAMDGYVSGGFFGQGPGNGLVKAHIPDAHTDFIFAVIGEEYGLVFCLALLLLFLFLVRRVLKKVALQKDVFCYLALFGLIMQFTLQVIVNIGVSVSILPTKGMTLPFISYGGSSLLAMSLCFGVILALTRNKYGGKIDYDNVLVY